MGYTYSRHICNNFINRTDSEITNAVIDIIKANFPLFFSFFIYFLVEVCVLESKKPCLLQMASTGM